MRPVRRGDDRRPAGGGARRPRAGRDPGGRSHPGHLWLLVTVASLLVFGLVMVLSASSVQSLRETGSTWTYFVRQATWLVVGLVVLITTSRLDYHRWRSFAGPLLGISLLLLIVVLLPGFGVEVNGARSWLGAGPLRFQPSELAKLGLLVFSADLLARRSARISDTRLSLRPVVAVAAGVVVLMMLQPDLGSTMVMGSVVVAVLFLAGVPLGPLTAVVTAGSGASLWLAVSEPYRRDRLLAFLHPSADPMNTGYQINQSLTGLASGGLLGVGLGQSRAKYGFLPNAHTDFIFTIIGEELGLLGASVVVGLFVLFGYLGVRAALRAPDRFGMLLAGGVTAWLLAQALVNVGGAVGLLPVTGLTLPFISFGGSSLLVTMAATGLLLNVARQGGRGGGGGADRSRRTVPAAGRR